MKELSIEEKAKAYDEAIEKFGVILNLNTVKESGTIFAADVRKVFPELAESEDERIRKELIAAFQNGDTFNQISKARAKDYIAWIEKQGEKEKFIKKELECIRGYRDEAIRRLHELEKQGEPTDIPADAVLDSNKDGLIADTVRRKREKQGEQKPADWSEEDESHIRYLIECLEHCKKGVALTMTTSTAQEYIDWLNPLKERVQPQSQWKPSDEQMVVLNDIIINGHLSNANERILKGLQEQLKKLKE